jgi:hypothetical protein
MNPSKERNHDNFTYVLCMLISMISGGCFKSMIKWSKFCAWDLKYVYKKHGQAVVGIYLC